MFLYSFIFELTYLLEFKLELQAGSLCVCKTLLPSLDNLLPDGSRDGLVCRQEWISLYEQQ